MLRVVGSEHRFRRGEDRNRQPAADGRAGGAVMMSNHVEQTDGELQVSSNRNFARSVASLPPCVPRWYGHVEQPATPLEQQLHAAMAVKDWDRAATLPALLARRQRRDAK
jgi:hypothetical protein